MENDKKKPFLTKKNLMHILCYLTIIICLFFIVVPPVLWIFMEDEAPEPEKVLVSELVCTKNEETVYISFLNGKAYNLKLVVDLNKLADEVVNDDTIVIEDDIDESKKVTDNEVLSKYSAVRKMLELNEFSKKEKVSNELVYTVVLNDNTVSSEYRNDIDHEALFFRDDNYTCNKHE